MLTLHIIQKCQGSHQVGSQTCQCYAYDSGFIFINDTWVIGL